MRLTCPNCDAQYEVDDRAIPDTGRDVQCSNCGHAWFQLPPHVEEPLEDEAETFDDAPEPVAPAAASSPSARRPSVSSPSAPFPPVDPPAAPQAVAAAPEPDPAPPVPQEPRRRPLDETVQAVLREEAERERRAREAERGAIETQPDLGLQPPRPVPPRSAPLPPVPPAVDEDDDDGAEDPQPRATRRDLLPDIEQINSTLRATGGPKVALPPEADDEPAPVAPRRGFRRGFTLALLLVILVLAVYTSAPMLAQKVPALSPALHALVWAIDGYRVWVDRLLTAATASMHQPG